MGTTHDTGAGGHLHVLWMLADIGITVAIPIVDSGDDILACRRREFWRIQIKTSNPRSSNAKSVRTQGFAIALKEAWLKDPHREAESWLIVVANTEPRTFFAIPKQTLAKLFEDGKWGTANKQDKPLVTFTFAKQLTAIKGKNPKQERTAGSWYAGSEKIDQYNVDLKSWPPDVTGIAASAQDEGKATVIPVGQNPAE